MFMFELLKHEMALVHSTDENRESVMEYVGELDSMQEKKLEMIYSLRKVSIISHSFLVDSSLS